MFDVAVVGGGIAGMATAARLQAAGQSTVVLESHKQPGGCAGFFCRRGFSFDVGATTLVDFEPHGVGGEFLRSIGMPPLAHELLPGYRAWLPDRIIDLHRDTEAWSRERLARLGSSVAHQGLWSLLDRLAATFWEVSRRGAKLPLQKISDVVAAIGSLKVADLPLLRYLNWTMGDALRSFNLREDKPLTGLLSMLIEDTVHSSLDRAPLINAALGITIRGAGISRALGGMRGFWRQLVQHYERLGGELRLAARATRITGNANDFTVATERSCVHARQIVSALPAALTKRLASDIVGRRLDRFLSRDADCQGGAIVMFLGVPEAEVANQAWTHHQILHSYAAPLGCGNNMFISVSSSGDLLCAPRGHRAVMISTHCDLASWKDLTPEEYATCKEAMGKRLLEIARRVYPRLASEPIVYEVATPQTFLRFTERPDGAVGGVKQSLANSNQQAIPHDIGIPGFYLVGDSTWPGLGTVACVLGSRIVAKLILADAKSRKDGSREHRSVSRPQYAHAD